MKNLGVSTPVAGAGVALAAGLLLGAAMRPQLAIDELSPQPIGAWSGEPEVAGADDALAYAAYGGQLPTYVIGSDFLTLTAPPEGAASPPASDDQPAAAEENQPTPARSEAAPAAASQARPVAAQVPVATSPEAGNATTEPPPIPALPIDETAAPPEATGDTTHDHPPAALQH